jgi:phenylalanyl-tRNA synthetase beta chain
VMGGLESEVTPQTVDVLLESANFDFISVRRTSAQLRIPSEAAQRFGRGVDSELTLVALRRAAELMRQLGGGTVAQGFADAYPNPPAPKVIDLRPDTINRLLGVRLAADEIAGMLTRLGFGCQVVAGSEPVVRTNVPTFRQDVSIPADLAEEVARIYGYDRLPETLISDQMPRQERNLGLELEERARDVLVGAGLTEILSYSMTNLESIARLSPERQMPEGDAYIRLANPLTREHEYLRQTLMNTTLEAVSRNLRFVDQVKIFEIAHVYLPQEGQKLPAEPTRACIALAGPREQRSWLNSDGAELDFYDLKGVIETFCRHMGLPGVTFAPTERATFHPGRVASVSMGEQVLGILGEVHPTVRANYDMPDQRICLAELDLSAIIALAQPIGRFVPISRMPTLKLDLALVVDEQVATDALSASLREAGGALLADAVLFDVYRGAQVGEGKKSLAYSLTFQALDRTLTSEEAVKQRERIVRQLQRLYGAEMRG